VTDRASEKDAEEAMMAPPWPSPPTARVSFAREDRVGNGFDLRVCLRVRYREALDWRTHHEVKIRKFPAFLVSILEAARLKYGHGKLTLNEAVNYCLEHSLPILESHVAPYKAAKDRLKKLRLHPQVNRGLHTHLTELFAGCKFDVTSAGDGAEPESFNVHCLDEIHGWILSLRADLKITAPSVVVLCVCAALIDQDESVVTSEDRELARGLWQTFLDRLKAITWLTEQAADLVLRDRSEL
jgi:hypothetical protein